MSWLLFTATLPPAAVADICNVVGIDEVDLKEIRCPTGSLRSQMAYRVFSVTSSQQRSLVLEELLLRHLEQGEAGIIYCSERSRCERLAAKFAAAAHPRSHTDTEWHNGEDGIVFCHAGVLED